ncbi:MAG: hypothetical protein OXN89_18460 [Bryobacterales bacterium]|nr:hypothetical protein [Bryobacterales bacterium]
MGENLQKKAQDGEKLLRDAVMRCLYRVAQRAGVGLQRGEIHEALGLTRGEKPYPHTLTRAILALLQQEGIAKRVGGRSREWTLTPEGLAIAELDEVGEAPPETQTDSGNRTH